MKDTRLLLKKDLQDRCRQTAQKAADKLYAAALRAIGKSGFYGSYTPRYYDRTGTLASTPKRYRKVESGSNGKIYWGGVQFEQGSWSGAGISNEEIMENTIKRGSHGWAGRDGIYYEILSFPIPYDAVLQAANLFAASVKK